ncbi:MAG: NADH-quinone oxidoreductase subunit N [Cyclobacteriaceae bacterium]
MNALYILCGLGILSLVSEILNFKKGLLPMVMVGLPIAIVAAALDWNNTVHFFGNMVIFDHFALAFTVLICIVAFFWFWMAHSYFDSKEHLTDQAALVLFSLVGGIILTSINNMAMLFLGIEILSIALYVLAGSKKDSLFSTEAAFKYFLMGSFATGFLLMGIALIYGATGSFELTKIAAFISAHPKELPLFFYSGVLLVLIGMSFKISAVPFHFWAPDVYQGAPTAITAFMSTIVKIAAFAAIIRLFAGCFIEINSTWLNILSVTTVLTLVLANVTAVYQTNVKRMLAYSSVGHAGYVLIALLSGGNIANVVLYYLAGYSIASLIAFTVLNQLEENNQGITIESFNGLFNRNRFLAVAMTIALLSLAGIPPLAGFFGKYLLLSLAVGAGLIWLVALAIITSVIGVYYYFKIILAMYFKSGSQSQFPVSFYQRLLLAVLLILAFILGIFPDLFQVL